MYMIQSIHRCCYSTLNTISLIMFCIEINKKIKRENMVSTKLIKLEKLNQSMLLLLEISSNMVGTDWNNKSWRNWQVWTHCWLVTKHSEGPIPVFRRTHNLYFLSGMNSQLIGPRDWNNDLIVKNGTHPNVLQKAVRWNIVETYFRMRKHLTYTITFSFN